MIKIVEGSILDASENIIGHQVNCQGVMGAGLAKQIRNKYPEVLHNYSELVSNSKNKSDLLGRMQLVTCGENKWVANIFGQYSYGRGNVNYTSYIALEDAMIHLREFAIKHNLTVALPFGIGCGLAGGNWDTVEKIIDNTFEHRGVTLYRFK